MPKLDDYLFIKIDDAMVAIEKENPVLKGVLPKDYARPSLDKTRLGELIDLVSTIGLGDEASRSKDILGRVYEYFLGQFASAEGKGGGEFYTPQSVVKLLVEMSDEEIARIGKTYHAWRGEKGAGKYADVAGFCKSATTEEITGHGFVPTPGRYVGAEEIEDDGEPFEEKMQRLTTTLFEQFAESARLEKAIRKNLKELGYGG